jgi:DNA (cytosine-5)-methyltransferase 1
MLRAIREIKPKYIVGENVFGLLNWNGGMVFDEVHSDLESEGYEVQAVVIPAAAVNAPHGRDRVWFVAFNTKSSRSTEVGGICEGSDNESIGICAKNGITSNTQFKSEGSDAGTNNKTERNIRRGNEGDVFGTLRSDGITTNPKECGCRGGMCERCAGGEWKLLSDEQRRSEMGSEIEGHSGIGDVANTDSIRLQHTKEARNIQEGTRTTQGKRGKSAKPIETNGSNGDVTDTRGIGFQRKGGSTQLEGGRFGFNNPQNNKTTWDNFPTQSPICGGDDGLPTELDGITFSKWRNESIKAYGNAIVPQVAYEIFKAIEATIQGVD